MATAQTNDRVRPEQVAAVLAVALVAQLRRARIDPDQWLTQLQGGSQRSWGQASGDGVA